MMTRVTPLVLVAATSLRRADAFLSAACTKAPLCHSRRCSSSINSSSTRRHATISSEYGTVPAVDESKVAVLFDFDGTVGDTETPAMRVAFWELAPYLVVDDVAQLESQQESFVRNNAGKAFEFMLDVCEAERKAHGLPGIDVVHQAKTEHADVLAIVDANRQRLGLPPLHSVHFDTLLDQQKEETVQALAKVAAPTPGMGDVLAGLRSAGTPFAISTTSPKPRVPVSITSCGFDEYFPPEKVHSGESDFDPPRFKPAPDVYLRAAAHEGALPERCIAVEDSESGVGSAANAGIGFIIGYVGASHVPKGLKETHANALMAGKRADNGRGADIVVEDMSNLLALVDAFKHHGSAKEAIKAALPKVTGNHWLNSTAKELVSK